MKSTINRILLYILLPLILLVVINLLTGNSIIFLRYILAAAPILIVLIVMTVFHIGGQYAGTIGLFTGILIAYFAFGLNWQVLWVSQLKGICLTLYVLAVFWPALFLYNIVNEAGGIQSIALALEQLITDRATLLIVVAWAFSAMLEGLAGFGIPVAIVSPILVGLGVTPILAVSAVAVGHAWAVSFGNMGMVFQTLISVVDVDPSALASQATIILGVACLICGFAVANIFKSLNRWLVILSVAAVMSTIQYFIGTSQLTAMTNFFAGLAGVTTGVVINRLFYTHGNRVSWPEMTPSLRSGIFSYGSLAILMAVITLIQPLNAELARVTWIVSYPEVQTMNGFITDAVKAQTYRPLLHPGTAILVIAGISYLINRRKNLYKSIRIGKIAINTSHSASPAMLGVLTMVGLSAVMDHTRMTFQLAEALSNLFGAAFPIVSPLIGMIGAFATGSNNNSNVLFGSLQEGIAIILHLSPAIIVSAQTAGGSLGSMIAPAKIIIGCSTVNIKGQDGEVLRKTLPYGITIAFLMGIVTLILIYFF